MAQDPAFPNAGSVSFGEDPIYRLLDDLLAAGVVALASDYQVIQNHLGANMSVDVNPGSAYVGITNGGKRRTRLPAQSNSGIPGTPNAADNWLTTFTAADATNPRVDRVVLTVRDSSIDGSGAYNSALRVIAGTPTSGATLSNLNGAAAVPANSILLANVLVPNSATTIITANISDQRPAARIGGNVPGAGTDGWTALAQTLTYSSADGHTFVCTTSADLSGTIPLGARIKLTHAAATKYFIVTAIDATTITLYGGTTYTLAATAITAPSFSVAKAPFGFPLNPVLWTEEMRDTAQRAQIGAVQNTWYNPGALSLAIPIGAWWVEWTAEIATSAAAGSTILGTLSTANNTESDTDFTVYWNNAGVSYGIVTGRRKAIVLAAKTSYFLNVRSLTAGTPTVYSSVGDVPTIVRAVCAYL
jgi:hypothetical protein